MAERILSGKIKQLVYTTEELSQSPLSTTVIDNGVLVYEKTSSGQIKCKMGDGNNVWSGLNYIEDSDKMDKTNPTGTGSFSMNRAKGSTVGENSVALGTNCIASGNNAYAEGWNTFAANYRRFSITNIIQTTDAANIHVLYIDNSTSGWNGLNSDIYIQGYDNDNNEYVIFKTKILYFYEKTDHNNNTYYEIRVDESNMNAFSTDDSTNTSYYNIFVDYSNDYTINSPHTEGEFTIASGDHGSHAEGSATTASGDDSHAEGSHTTASGNYGSHAEGYYTTASGDDSHAEGSYTTASGNNSHAEGDDTIASSNCQHVQGKYNIEDTSSTYAHIVGGGTSRSDRKNIHTLDWNGNAVFSGDVTATKSDGTEVSLLNLKSTLDSIQVQNFYTGIEAPSNTLGEDGDLYLIT